MPDTDHGKNGAVQEKHRGKLIPIDSFPPFSLSCSDAHLALHALKEYVHQKGRYSLSLSTLHLIEKLDRYLT